jgi:hypothetical protein
MEVPSIEGGALQKGRRILAITVFSIEYPARKTKFEILKTLLNLDLSTH